MEEVNSFDITASRLVRHIAKCAWCYDWESEDTDDHVTHRFKDSGGDVMEEISFPKSQHPALIRLIDKILNTIKSKKGRKKQS